MNRSNLAHAVKARNELNALANRLQTEIRNSLWTRLGKKVVKVTPYKNWIAPLQTSIGLIQLPSQRHTLSFQFTDYSVWAELQTYYDVPGQSSVQYVKLRFHIGRLEDGTILTELVEPNLNPYRTDYTVEEVAGALDRIEALKEEVQELQSQVREFR